MKENLRTSLQQGVSELGLTLSDFQIEQFLLYLEELIKWNAKINLTGTQDAFKIIQYHFIDSLSCLLSGVLEGTVRIMDVGTGAGFPGLPLKIYNPNLRLTLLDASQKKVFFLKNVCRRLGILEVNCLAKRVEDLTDHEETRFDVVVSRAVGSLTYLVNLCGSVFAIPFTLLLQRGPEGEREVSEGLPQIQKAGFGLVKLVPVKLSFLDHRRYLVLLQKKEVSCST
jgi:16S rRNA (guanine527-N7)-methyltransferase